ncbi:MAG: acetylglutamate kinase [Treponema sp.]|nr:acetylglutamate kinase [Treponema sp.]MCL2251323.1 acetylglutamate kinase [Treponema sp.]
MTENTINNNDRAKVLIHALPYIQSFYNKTIVVKYGGNAMLNDELKKAVIEDVILMSCVGIRTVLVHGGGPEIEAMLKKTGKESRFVNGLRYTDEETMDIVQMVLCGKINKEIAALIQKTGGKAIGLCGIDGALLKARRMKEDLGLVGEIEDVDVTILNSILETEANGVCIIPVISSVAYGIGEDEGKSLNINADTAAAKIAAALGAEKLVLMTDVRGIMRDVNDETSLIKFVARSQLESLKKEGIISKGMIPKVDCCATALYGGVKKAHIIDGRLPHAILIELFTDEGVGTMIE